MRPEMNSPIRDIRYKKRDHSLYRLVRAGDKPVRSRRETFCTPSRSTTHAGPVIYVKRNYPTPLIRAYSLDKSLKFTILSA